MAKNDLPPNITAADLEYPKPGDGIPYEEKDALSGLDWWDGSLTFRLIKEGWVILTLHISNPSRRQRGRGIDTERSYGIGLKDSKVWRTGKGPHVLKEVRVHASKSNIERLRPYIELMRKGMEDAGAIRDRISSRRAQGQLYREQGRSSWQW